MKSVCTCPDGPYRQPQTGLGDFCVQCGQGPLPSVEEVRAEIHAEALAAALRPLLQGAREGRADADAPRQPLSDDRAWTTGDVAYFLSVSTSEVRKLEREGHLPALPRVGKAVRFDPQIVRKFRDGWRPGSGDVVPLKRR